MQREFKREKKITRKSKRFPSVCAVSRNVKDHGNITKSGVLHTEGVVRRGLHLICASADCRLQLKLFLLSGHLMFPSPTPLTLPRLSSLLHNNTKVFMQDQN